MSPTHTFATAAVLLAFYGHGAYAQCGQSAAFTSPQVMTYVIYPQGVYPAAAGCGQSAGVQAFAAAGDCGQSAAAFAQAGGCGESAAGSAGFSQRPRLFGRLFGRR